MFTSVSRVVLGFVGVTAALFVALPFSASAASLCTPENSTMYVVAHEDDAILFQNPDLQHDISAGKCVMTVFMTSGEAGRVESEYRLAREAGAKAATAYMAGVPDVWTLSDAGIPGHSVAKFTLDGNPKITTVFFRLPDGGVPGIGFDTYGSSSLQKLYQGTQTTITSVDTLNMYTKSDLVSALLSLLNSEKPGRINTQDFATTYPVFGTHDHSDHIAAAFFIRSATWGYNTPHTLYSYRDYDTSGLPENVTGLDALTNELAFFTYTPFDEDACQTVEECSLGSYYGWLKRQYTNGSILGGDYCPNIEGPQATIPEGMIVSDGVCKVPGSTCVDTSSTFNVVSDETNTVSSGGNAVATFVPPSWTAVIPGATWIWNAFHVADPTQEETLTFTKTFTVVGSSTSGLIYIASDDDYRASLNGTEFAVVGDIVNYTSETEDNYDVTGLLREGENTLSITVHNIAQEGLGPDLNPAGLRYNLRVSESSCVVPPPTVCPEGTTGEYPACVPIVVTPPTGGGGSGGGQSYTYGCTNPQATNYNPSANSDDNTCILPSTSTSGSQGAGAEGVGSTAPTGTGEVLGATTEEPVLPPSCSAYITSYMKQGGANDSAEVTKLQTFLNEEMGATIPVTGYFGPSTKMWVKKFQKKYHAEILQPWIDAGFNVRALKEGTGVVYKMTKYKINLMKCASLTDPKPTATLDY